MNTRTTCIIGGARSGKSQRALRLATETGRERVFIATAEPSDAEMARRIERHRAERGARFRTVEAPLDLVEALQDAASDSHVVVVDCLTLWLSNLLHHDRDAGSETDLLTGWLAQAPGSVILVSNEAGMGLVPENRLGRDFRDAQGTLNHAVVEVCERVEFMVAGLPLTLKPA